MKGSMQWNLSETEKFLPPGINLGLLDQQASAQPIELQGFLPFKKIC